MWVGHSPMRVTLGWARCADNVADILRRGAWYPIVEESSDGQVVVEVRQQRVRVPRADRCLDALTAQGRFRVDRWLRMEHLADDFADLISTLIGLDEGTRERIAGFPDVNALKYDHDPSHWFTPERVRRLYENNPHWAAAERETYGDLALLD